MTGTRHAVPRGSRMARRPVVASGFLVFASAVAISSAISQPARPAFDRRSDLDPGHESTVIARGDLTGDGTPDLIVAGPGHITVFRQGRTSHDWNPVRPPAAQGTPVAAVTGRLNNDAREDLVLLSGPRPCLAEVFLSDRRGVPVLSATFELPGDYRQAFLGDPDGDGDLDLLFCGKKTLGVAVYTGNGRGSFTPGPVLFQEVPVSQAAVAMMDADDLPDFIVADWLGNDLQVYPGFGGLNFGDPSVLHFEEEPLAFAVGDVNGDRMRDLVAGFGDHPSIAVLSGDGAGKFRPSAREELPVPPAKIRIGDLDGDARNDLLVFLPDAATVSVLLQDTTGRPGSRQDFATGASPTDVVFFKDARRRFLNAAVVSREWNVVRLLHTRSTAGGEQDGLSLATGPAPGDLDIEDLNGDGWPDILLAQGAGPSLDLYTNDGRGGLRARLSLPAPFPAATLYGIARSIGAKEYLATSDRGTSIAYLSLDPSTLMMSSSSVRTDTGTIAVDGRRLTGRPSRRVYAVKEGKQGHAAVAIVSYDLDDGTRYEENEEPVPTRGRVVALTAADVDGDGRKDIVTLTAADSQSFVTILPQTGEGFRHPHTMPLAWDASAIPPGVPMWVADLNGDDAPDIVLNFPKPAYALAVSLSGPDSSFTSPRTVLSDVRVPGERSLVVSDFDNDGTTDLVFVNDRTRTVQFLPGDGGGGFEGPVNLTSARGVRGFGIGDIDRDGVKDLVISNAERGVLSITTFHHPLFFRKGGRGRE